MHNHKHTHSSSRIGWAFFLNFGFTIIEFIGGYFINSTAIMADAVHDLGDTLSIGTAWWLEKLSNKPANNEFSYGYRRLSLLGSLINGVVLVTGSIWVLSEAIPRLYNPQMPIVEGMFFFAIFGMAVNGFAAYKLSKGKTLNEKVLNWHLLEDVLGWVAVFIVSTILIFVDWPVLDPILSIGFTIFILVNVLRNVLQTSRIFMQSTPDKEISEKIKRTLKNTPEFSNFHHFHLWSLDGENHVLTVHIRVDEDITIKSLQSLKTQFNNILAEFSLRHTTVEFEFGGEICRDNQE